MADEQTPQVTPEFMQAVKSLLKSGGIDGEFSISQLSGGANNRSFRVSIGADRYFLKAYFHHPDDIRDRLGAEWGFSSFAFQNGVRRIPAPISHDSAFRIGLYEFIEGRKMTPSELTSEIIRQAIDFCSELQAIKTHPGAEKLPNGSESCFSIADHLKCVERRVERLRHIETDSEIDRAAEEFISNSLIKTWEITKNNVLNDCAEKGLPPASEILSGDRCISPSDFGFHNALITPAGDLKFIDFEYAGWDDTAKLVCDFFCQPEVPVPYDFFEAFSAAAAEKTSQPELNMSRYDLLLPVYRIKWACIILNDFLPAGGARRGFAKGGSDEKKRKEIQLEKAVRAVEKVM